MQISGKYFKMILKKTILICNLWESKSYGVWQLIWEFSDKNWKQKIKKFVKKGA